jgi:hypothetical protein
MKQIIILLSISALSISNVWAQASKAKKPAPKATAKPAPKAAPAKALAASTPTFKYKKISDADYNTIVQELNSIGLNKADYVSLNALSNEACAMMEQDEKQSDGSLSAEAFNKSLVGVFTKTSEKPIYKSLIKKISSSKKAEDAEYALGKLIGANLVYTGCPVMLKNMENILAMNEEEAALDSAATIEQIEAQLLATLNNVDLSASDMPAIDAIANDVCKCLDGAQLATLNAKEIEEYIALCLSKQEDAYKVLAKKSKKSEDDVIDAISTVIGARLSLNNCKKWLEALEAMGQ